MHSISLHIYIFYQSPCHHKTRHFHQRILWLYNETYQYKQHISTQTQQETLHHENIFFTDFDRLMIYCKNKYFWDDFKSGYLINWTITINTSSWWMSIHKFLLQTCSCGAFRIVKALELGFNHLRHNKLKVSAELTCTILRKQRIHEVIVQSQDFFENFRVVHDFEDIKGVAPNPDVLTSIKKKLTVTSKIDSMFCTFSLFAN